MEERCDRFQKRSIKKESKVHALKLALSMIDLTTLEGADSPGKVRLSSPVPQRFTMSANIGRVALCHGLGLNVVAEGVERPAQLGVLAQYGPVSVQGYLLARPVLSDMVVSEATEAALRARKMLAALEVQPRIMRA